MAESVSRRPAWAAAVLALILTLLLGAAAAASAAAQDGGDAKRVHKQKKKHRKPPLRYWGAWLGSQHSAERPPWDMTGISVLEAAVGKSMSLIEFSSPFADCSVTPCSYYEFPAAEMDRVRAYGAIPFFSWGSQTTPWDFDEASDNEPNVQLRNVANGTYDSYIHQFAAEAAAWGRPFFLRFDWEMNGNWFPWGENVNSNVRGDFVPAWQHVHDVFAAAGASNVTWVWCPYTDASKRFLDLRRFYPGDAYVDWTCLDAFNWGSNPANPGPWRNFDQLLAAGYERVVEKIAPSKPMILAEIASSPYGGYKARWVRRMMDSLKTKYPRIRGLIWYDQIDRGIDWLIESSPGVTREFGKGIRTPRYLPNLYGGLEASPIPPPR